MSNSDAPFDDAAGEVSFLKACETPKEFLEKARELLLGNAQMAGARLAAILPLAEDFDGSGELHGKFVQLFHCVKDFSIPDRPQSFKFFANIMLQP